MMRAMTLNLKSIKVRPHEIIQTAAENWRLLLLAMLFVCGLLSGSAICGGNSEVAKVIGNLTEKAFSLSTAKNFSYLFALNACFAAVALFSGLSAIGLPVILATPCINGAVVGAVCSFFYLNYKLDGVIFSLIIIIPFTAITALMIIIGCNEAAIVSGIIAKSAFSAGGGGRGEMNAYFLRFGIIIVVVCVCALIQAACLSGFGSQLLD